MKERIILAPGAERIRMDMGRAERIVLHNVFLEYVRSGMVT